MRIISATDLARRTRDILDGIARGGEPVGVERNRVVVARIVAPERTMTAAEALAGLPSMLAPGRGRAWRDDSRAGGFDEGVRDPWA